MLSSSQMTSNAPSSSKSKDLNATRWNDDVNISAQPPSYESAVSDASSNPMSAYIHDLRGLTRAVERHEIECSRAPIRLPPEADRADFEDLVRTEMARFLRGEGIQSKDDLSRYTVDSITSAKIRSWSKKFMKVSLSSSDMACATNLDHLALLIAAKKEQS